MTAILKKYDDSYTPAEFLDLLPTLEGKFELRDGKLVDYNMMAGGSEKHSLIAAHLVRHMGNALDGGPCRVYGSDFLIRIGSKSSYRLPDLSVVCGPCEFERVDDGRRLAVTNPVLVIEVLSESTEADDRGAKFAEYRDIATLREYVLVSQQRPLVETFRRHDDGTWGTFTIAEGLAAALAFTSIPAMVPLAAIYAGVALSDAAPPAV